MKHLYRAFPYIAFAGSYDNNEFHMIKMIYSYSLSINIFTSLHGRSLVPIGYGGVNKHLFVPKAVLTLVSSRPSLTGISALLFRLRKTLKSAQNQRAKTLLFRNAS